MAIDDPLSIAMYGPLLLPVWPLLLPCWPLLLPLVWPVWPLSLPLMAISIANYGNENCHYLLPMHGHLLLAFIAISSAMYGHYLFPILLPVWPLLLPCWPLLLPLVWPLWPLSLACMAISIANYGYENCHHYCQCMAIYYCHLLALAVPLMAISYSL